MGRARDYASVSPWGARDDECSFGALEDDEDSLDEENPELPDEFAADIEEEMQTDMLRTWVEGLCIELRELSRVLAHAPSWGIE